jgi:putative ABC transport system permease protein
MVKDYFIVATRSISNRKVRALLTVLGIIISITAIVALILLGEGLKGAINEQFESMGTNVIMVMPKGMMMGGIATTELLSIDDVDHLESMPYFEYITPMAMKAAEKIEYRNNAGYIMITAIPYDDLSERFGDWNWELIDGSIPDKRETRGVLIGYSIWKDTFEEKIHANTNVLIGGEKFRVIGILDKIGNQQDDTSVMMDIDTFREEYNNPRQVDAITLEVKKGFDVDAVAEKLEVQMERRRDDENFEVYTMSQLMTQVNTMLGGVTFMLSAIGFISLIVGGIGIMNSMYTNVLERTNEIGIMKSIGAKNKDIMKIFLIESGIIGLIGGVIGVIFGQILTLYIAEIITSANFLPIDVSINYPVLIGMVLFAIIISLISGYLPAKRASKLKPVDALRYD